MFAFALKNMLRYKMRSLITLLVVIVTAFTSLVALGFTQGLIDLAMASFVRFQTGHIRITTPEYYQDIRFRPVYQYVSDLDKLTNQLIQYPQVKQVIPTFNIFGLVSIGGESYQSRGVGLPLDNNAYDFPSQLREGDVDSLILGEKFKEKLGVNVGDGVLIATTSSEGGLNAVKPILGGVTQFNMKAFDNNMFFMELSNAQRLLKAPDSATEIFLHLHKTSDTSSFTKQLKTDFPQLSIQSYHTQLGALAYVMELQSKVIVFFAIFIMILGSLSIVNSLVASIYDRITEIGTLKAIGYTNKELSTMMVYEGFIYGIIGGTIGTILGVMLLEYFAYYGMDFSRLLSATNLPIEPIFYPVLELPTYIISFLISISVPALVSLFPRKHMMNITPIDALRG